MNNSEKKDNLNKSEKVLKFFQKYGMFFWLAVSLTAVIIVFAYIINSDKNENQIKYSYVSPQSSEDDSQSNSKSKNKDNRKSKTSNIVSSKSQKITSVHTKKEKSKKITQPQVNFPIEINSATEYELMQIKGVGENYAKKILEYKNKVGIIYNLDLLKNIDGIGEKKLEILKQYLYVDKKYYKKITVKASTTTQTEITTTTSVNKTTAPTISRPNKITRKSTTTKRINVTSADISKSEETTTQAIREKVNINTADAEEISQKLLIDISLAMDIVGIRNRITYFTSPYELLYVEGISKEFLTQIIDYIEI